MSALTKEFIASSVVSNGLQKTDIDQPITIKVDTTTLGNVLPALSATGNGLGVKVDTGSIGVNASNQLEVNKLMAYFAQIDNVASGTNQNLNVDTAVTGALPGGVSATPRNDFSTGEGIYVDASGDYGTGTVTLPTPVQVTRFGKPGTVIIRDYTTGNAVDDGAGNEVYGVLFFNTNGVENKFYLGFYSDPSGTQTTYSFSLSTAIDFKFVPMVKFSNLPGQALVSLPGAFVDVVAGDITEVVAGSGLTGGATTGSATLDVGQGDGITVTANAVSVKADTLGSTNVAPAINIDPTEGVGVKIDNLTINHVTGQLQVKDNGITATQIHTSAISNGLTGGGGVAISVLADGTLTASGVMPVNVSGLGVSFDTATIPFNTNTGIDWNGTNFQWELLAYSGANLDVTPVTLDLTGVGVDNSALKFYNVQFTYDSGNHYWKVLSADTFPVSHTAVNYTAGSTNLDDHLAGIDTALAAVSTETSVTDELTCGTFLTTYAMTPVLTTTPLYLDRRVKLFPVGGIRQRYAVDYGILQVTDPGAGTAFSNGVTAGYYIYFDGTAVTGAVAQLIADGATVTDHTAGLNSAGLYNLGLGSGTLASGSVLQIDYSE